MYIDWPVRMIVIGGSSTGKTSLLRTAILRGEFGRRPELNIIVMSPSEQSLQQVIWTDLESRGFSIQRIACDMRSKVREQPLFQARAPSEDKRRRLVIIDDADQVGSMHVPISTPLGRTSQNGKQFITELFGTESHHTDTGCIVVSHKLNIGVPAIRNSANHVVLTALSPDELKRVVKNYALSPIEISTIRRAHENPAQIAECAPTGRFCIPSGECRNYNHVVLLTSPMVDSRGVPLPRIWRFGDKASSPVGIEQVKPPT